MDLATCGPSGVQINSREDLWEAAAADQAREGPVSHEDAGGETKEGRMCVKLFEGKKNRMRLTWQMQVYLLNQEQEQMAEGEVRP